MRKWKHILGILALAQAAACLAFSQAPAPAAKPADSGGSYSTVDVSPFAGWQWFQAYANGATRSHRLDDGEIFGVRVNQDFSRYIGLEESFTWGPANHLSLLPFGDSKRVSAGTHNYEVAITPMIYMTPRESKVRPFVTVGPGYTWFTPNHKSQQFFTSAGDITASMHGVNSPALVYGLGIKVNASRVVGFRIDARGSWTKAGRFGLPKYPPAPGYVYAGDSGGEQAIQLTGGIMFRFGHHEPPPPPAPAPPPPPPPPPPPVTINVNPIQGARDICPGESLTLNVSASGWRPDQTPTYQWTINGQPVPGANGPSLTFPSTGRTGSQQVAVRVSAGDASATSNPVTVNIKNAGPPTITFAVNPTTIALGDRLPLNAMANGTECTNPVNVTYRASEGSVTGNNYDSSTVSMDMSNRLRLQTKTITLTATATDKNGATANATANVTVTLKPEARRLEDIVFPASSARVNNCAKRVLLEELTPLLRDDPSSKVIFVGHSDMSDRGRAAASIDQRRVLNSAAVISAGAGICPSLEVSRINGNWVGSDQSTPTRANFCGASTNVKERPGQTIRPNDPRAQYRRVEVWFVPGGADMPAGVTGRDLPEAQVKALGCPR